jgi:adenosylmethionine-8-amino-7-oxononanoate aminotransferase
MASPLREPSLLHRTLTQHPHTVTSASGSYLHLSDGRTILDACGGAAVSILGHSNPEVIAATLTQMQAVSYVHTGSYTTRSAPLWFSARPGQSVLRWQRQRGE